MLCICRGQGLRLEAGCVYEDVSAGQEQASQVPGFAAPLSQAPHEASPQDVPASSARAELLARLRLKRPGVHRNSTILLESSSSDDSDDNFRPHNSTSTRGSPISHVKRLCRHSRNGRGLRSTAVSASSGQNSDVAAAECTESGIADPSCKPHSPASREAAADPQQEYSEISQHDNTAHSTSLDTDPLSDSEDESSDADAKASRCLASSPVAPKAAARVPSLMVSPDHFSSSTSILVSAGKQRGVAPTAAAQAATAPPVVAEATSRPSDANTALPSATKAPPQLAEAMPATNIVPREPPAPALVQQRQQAAVVRLNSAGPMVSQAAVLESKEVLAGAGARVSGEMSCVAASVPGQPQRQPAATPAAAATAAARVMVPQSSASTSAAAQSPCHVSLSEAAAVTNQRLQTNSDFNCITEKQVQGLESSLSGMSDLLRLDKGDIRDILTDKTFGGGLTVKQALYMQAYILELKQLQ